MISRNIDAINFLLCKKCQILRKKEDWCLACQTNEHWLSELKELVKYLADDKELLWAYDPQKSKIVWIIRDKPS